MKNIQHDLIDFSFLVLTCTAEGDITLIQLNLFEAGTDAMGSGTTGTTDGETGPLHLESGCKDSRTG